MTFLKIYIHYNTISAYDGTFFIATLLGLGVPRSVAIKVVLFVEFMLLKVSMWCYNIIK